MLFQIPGVDIKNIYSVLYWILGQWDIPKGDIIVTFLISEFRPLKLLDTINISVVVWFHLAKRSGCHKMKKQHLLVDVPRSSSLVKRSSILKKLNIIDENLFYKLVKTQLN